MKRPRLIVAWTFAIAILGSTVQSQDSAGDTAFLDREVGARRGFVVGSPVTTWMSVLQLFQDLQLPLGWRLVDGVVVIRPATAWADADHPLHRPVPPVVLNTVTFAGATDGVLKATGQYMQPNANRTDDTRFSLQFPGGSLELLAGIVRAHGTFSWARGYCQRVSSGLDLSAVMFTIAQW